MDHTARSVAVIVFIGLAAAAAIYCAQRPTVARGSFLAASLAEALPDVRSLECQDEVPIGVAGATFECKAFLKNGDEGKYTFGLDRNGQFSIVDSGTTRAKPRIEKTTDPWAD